MKAILNINDNKESKNRKKKNKSSEDSSWVTYEIY